MRDTKVRYVARWRREAEHGSREVDLRLSGEGIPKSVTMCTVNSVTIKTFMQLAQISTNSVSFKAVSFYYFFRP